MKKLYLNSFASADGQERPAVEPTTIAVSIPKSSQEPVVTANLENGQNLAQPTRKKGVNWVLIGGIAIGSILLYKYLKKG